MNYEDRITVTEEQVTASMQKAIAEEGDGFIYPRAHSNCVYMYDGKPDCLVARVLVDLGLSIHMLHEHEGTTCSVPINMYFVMDDRVRRALNRAQRIQDKGKTWGEAFVEYKDLVANPTHANEFDDDSWPPNMTFIAEPETD